MVSLSSFLLLNTILLSALLAVAAQADDNDYWPSIFVLYEDLQNLMKRDLMADIENESRPKWKRDARFGGADIDGQAIADSILYAMHKNPHLPSVLQDMVKHKSEIQPYNPGDEETYRLEYFAYDNNDDWNKLKVGAKDDTKVLWHGANDDCLTLFTFKLPQNDSYTLDAHLNNDHWDLFVAGGSGDVVGDCKPEPKELTYQPALRLLLCHVWGIPH